VRHFLVPLAVRLDEICADSLRLARAYPGALTLDLNYISGSDSWTSILVYRSC
jgi:hypothetical protein